MTTNHCDSLLMDGTMVANATTFLPHQEQNDWADNGLSKSRPEQNGDGDPAIDASDRDAWLAGLSGRLPLSQVAVDVFDMSRLSGCDSGRIADAIARDEALPRDLLEIANRRYCNPAGRPISDVEDAVDRLGPKRVGELALAAGALSTWISHAGPWLNADLAWRRCIAAGVAVDLLVSEGGHQDTRDSLFLNALLHPLYRMALSAVYPRQYLEMTRRCQQHGVSLDDLETRVSPLSHGEVIERILKSWGLPSVVCEPLMYLGDTYESLSGLPEPLRTKTELLKLGVAIGRLAVGEWESWDRVEIPPSFIIKRSRCNSLAVTVARVAAHMADMVASRPPSCVGAIRPRAACDSFGELVYCSLSPQPFDFLAEIVSSMGVRMKPVELGDVSPDENVLVNCLWTYPHRLAERFGGRSGGGERLIVTDVTHLQPCARFGRVLTLPASYGTMRQACSGVARQPMLVRN
jgi:hypothetical protein